MNFPLNAEVTCSDGPVGKSSAVIVDPTTEQVTFVAVKVSKIAHTEYLVPVDLVEGSTRRSVTLRCTCAEVAGMESFIETEFVLLPPSCYSDDLYGHPGPEMMVIEHQQVPEGSLAVGRDSNVEATDGFVGAVNDLITDPESGQITHFVLHKGHLWGDVSVTLAVSQVDRVERNTVYLKMAKAEINAMPVVQARRHYSKKEINRLDIELLIITLIFKYVPDVTVAWSDVWIGAAATALLLSPGIWAISVFLAFSNVGAAYGAAGALFIILIWIYYPARIFLYGAKFTHGYASRFGSQIAPVSVEPQPPDDGVVAV